MILHCDWRLTDGSTLRLSIEQNCLKIHNYVLTLSSLPAEILCKYIHTCMHTLSWTSIIRTLSIWTCFSGPSFSWILISHISCQQQNYFALNYAIKLEVVSLQSTNLNVFNSHTHQNQYSACSCALIVSDLLCCWVKFHLLFSKLFSFALGLFILIFSITRTVYLDHSAQSPWVWIM